MRESTETHQTRSADQKATALAPSRLGIEKLWLLLPVLLLVYKGFIFPLPPLDFWWHLKMGEVIATTRSIPQVDSFSYTAEGHPFVDQNWLGELIYYWTYSLGGFPLLVFLGTLITVAGFLMMYVLCFEATRNARIVALVGFLAALGNYGFLRPQTYSFLLFAAFYMVLEQYRQRRQDRLWILPILMVIWVNLHGAFVMGLGLIAVYILGEGCRRVLDPARVDALSRVEIQKVLLIFILCIVGTVLNPEGPGIFDYVRTVATDAGSQQLVAEWRPPLVTDFLGFLLFYCPFLLTLLTFIYAKIKPDLTEALLFFGFAVAGLVSIRNGAWFSTIAYPLLARYIPHLDLTALMPLRRYRVINQLLETGSPSEVESPVYSRINLVALIAAALVLVTQSPWVRPGLTGASLVADQTPVGAADFISAKGLTGRIFHPQMFGDYLIWRLWPQQRTFVDGRVHLFSLDFLNQYKKAIEDPLSTDVVERWNIQYLLLSKSPEDENARALKSVADSGAWTRLYEDQISVLYEKRSR
jgi:hypothetical protein